MQTFPFLTDRDMHVLRCAVCSETVAIHPNISDPNMGHRLALSMGWTITGDGRAVCGGRCRMAADRHPLNGKSDDGDHSVDISGGHTATARALASGQRPDSPGAPGKPTIPINAHTRATFEERGVRVACASCGTHTEIHQRKVGSADWSPDAKTMLTNLGWRPTASGWTCGRGCFERVTSTAEPPPVKPVTKLNDASYHRTRDRIQAHANGPVSAQGISMASLPEPSRAPTKRGR